MNAERRHIINIQPGQLYDQHQAAQHAFRSLVFLPRAEVERRVGLKRSAIYARMKAGTFPKPIHDLETDTVWWLESEIEAWQKARIEARNMGDGMGRKSEAGIST